MNQLTSEQIEILKYLDKNVYIDRCSAFKNFSAHSDYLIDKLLKNGFIKIVNESTTSSASTSLDLYVLSGKGHSVLHEVKYKVEREKKLIQKDTFRFWVPIVINSLLSIIAIIISIIALLSK